jgi:hypothetical protein
MGETEMNEMESHLEVLVESLGQLFEMQNEDNDRKAIALYRAMFVNDKDINKLDFNYADHILGYAAYRCYEHVAAWYSESEYQV